MRVSEIEPLPITAKPYLKIANRLRIPVWLILPGNNISLRITHFGGGSFAVDLLITINRLSRPSDSPPRNAEIKSSSKA